MWLEARRLARGDWAELKKSLPSPHPRSPFLAAPTNMFSKHPDMDTGQAWASKTTHMSGGWTWDHLKLTHMRIMCIELHPSRLISKIHIWGWGLGLGAGP